MTHHLDLDTITLKGGTHGGRYAASAASDAASAASYAASAADADDIWAEPLAMLDELLALCEVVK